MKKLLCSAALSLFVVATALAQTTPMTKDDGKKSKVTVEGTTVKTKMADDGKMKLKAKDDAGNSTKASTKPRKGMKKDAAPMGGM